MSLNLKKLFNRTVKNLGFVTQATNQDTDYIK